MLHSNTLLSICRHICYTVTYTQTSKIMSDIKHHARRCAHFKYVWQRVYDCCVCQTQAKRASTIKIWIFFIICDYQFAVYGTQYTRFRINNSGKKSFFFWTSCRFWIPFFLVDVLNMCFPAGNCTQGNIFAGCILKF